MSQPVQGKPLVVVSVFLFGKPAWEIDGMEGSPIDIELLAAIEACGQELGKRLTRAAAVGRKLVASGWEGSGGLYDIEFYKTATLRDAEEEMKALGIEPDDVTMREEGEDPA